MQTTEASARSFFSQHTRGCLNNIFGSHMDSIGIDGCSQFQLFVSFGRHVLQTRIPFPKTGAGKTRTDEFGPERKSHMLLFWVIHPHQPALSMLVNEGHMAGGLLRSVCDVG